MRRGGAGYDRPLQRFRGCFDVGAHAFIAIAVWRSCWTAVAVHVAVTGSAARLRRAERRGEEIVVDPARQSARRPSPRSTPARSSARLRPRARFEDKYRQVYDSFAGDPELMGKIGRRPPPTASTRSTSSARSSASTPTTSTSSTISQGYYVKALAYLDNSRSAVRIQGRSRSPICSSGRSSLRCNGAGDDYELWNCRDACGHDVFLGKIVDGTSIRTIASSASSSSRFFAGQTFGLGQISPLAALMVSDLAAKAAVSMPRRRRRRRRSIAPSWTPT